MAKVSSFDPDEDFDAPFWDEEDIPKKKKFGDTSNGYVATGSFTRKFPGNPAAEILDELEAFLPHQVLIPFQTARNIRLGESSGFPVVDGTSSSGQKIRLVPALWEEWNARQLALEAKQDARGNGE